jgi:hypothetical protein
MMATAAPSRNQAGYHDPLLTDRSPAGLIAAGLTMAAYGRHLDEGRTAFLSLNTALSASMSGRGAKAGEDAVVAAKRIAESIRADHDAEGVPAAFDIKPSKSSGTVKLKLTWFSGNQTTVAVGPGGLTVLRYRPGLNNTPYNMDLGPGRPAVEDSNGTVVHRYSAGDPKEPQIRSDAPMPPPPATPTVAKIRDNLAGTPSMEQEPASRGFGR